MERCQHAQCLLFFVGQPPVFGAPPKPLSMCVQPAACPAYLPLVLCSTRTRLPSPTQMAPSPWPLAPVAPAALTFVSPLQWPKRGSWGGVCLLLLEDSDAFSIIPSFAQATNTKSQPSKREGSKGDFPFQRPASACSAESAPP